MKQKNRLIIIIINNIEVYSNIILIAFYIISKLILINSFSNDLINIYFIFCIYEYKQHFCYNVILNTSLTEKYIAMKCE